MFNIFNKQHIHLTSYFFKFNDHYHCSQPFTAGLKHFPIRFQFISILRNSRTFHPTHFYNFIPLFLLVVSLSLFYILSGTIEHFFRIFISISCLFPIHRLALYFSSMYFVYVFSFQKSELM